MNLITKTRRKIIKLGIVFDHNNEIMFGWCVVNRHVLWLKPFVTDHVCYL